MNRLIASLAAAGMLVAGAFVAVTITGAPADAQEAVMSAEAESGRGEAVLDEVLEDLVADGVITQSQSNEVREAFVEKREEFAAEREARREERRELRDLIQGFLEDDVIDADELAQLPDDLPWFDDDSALADALEDGELTKEELSEALPGHTHRHRHPHRGNSEASTDEVGDSA